MAESPHLLLGERQLRGLGLVLRSQNVTLKLGMKEGAG
jgi:hypothetical protein